MYYTIRREVQSITDVDKGIFILLNENISQAERLILLLIDDALQESDGMED